MGERIRIVTAALGSLALMGALAACSSSSSDDNGLRPEPTAPQTFATPTPVADGTKVAAGEWGIVKYHNASNGDQVFALRVTDVSKGKPGDFADITDFGGGALTPKSAIGWWIDYDWVNISGDKTWSPNQQIGAVAADESQQDDLSTLSVPEEYIHCTGEETETSFAKLDVIQHGCITAAGAKGVAPAAVYFNGVAPSSEDVTWALPKGKS